MWAIQSEVGSVQYYWIPGFGDTYVLGNDGSVWSRYQQVGRNWVLSDDWTRRLKQIPDKDGYLRVILRFNGKSYTKKVHQLVCEAVLGPCSPGEEVRHLDGVRSNNSWKNLVYGTKTDQYSDRIIHRTDPRGERAPGAKLTWIKVREIRIKYATGNYTMKDLALEYDVRWGTIWEVLHNITWIE
jgi:hypothetical protein